VQPAGGGRGFVLLGKKMGVTVSAVDTTRTGQGPATVLDNTPAPHTEFAHSSDTGGKRNLALLLARLMMAAASSSWTTTSRCRIQAISCGPVSYSTVHGGRPPDQQVSGQLRRLSAHRETGGASAPSSARRARRRYQVIDVVVLSRHLQRDWFFLLDDERLSPVAITGVARQKRYNPYATSVGPIRGIRDCLAEGCSSNWTPAKMSARG